jgi:hypothetical protein
VHQIYLHRQVFVGDVVLLQDPEKSDDLIIRRLAALEGYEMVSSDEKDEPFVLEKDQCWVLADNQALKPKVCMLFMLVIITCVILLGGVAPRYARFCYVNLRCYYALTEDSHCRFGK